jgi:hypothetical protein
MVRIWPHIGACDFRKKGMCTPETVPAAARSSQYYTRIELGAFRGRGAIESNGVAPAQKILVSLVKYECIAFFWIVGVGGCTCRAARLLHSNAVWLGRV